MGQHLKSCQAAVVSSAAGGDAGQPPLSEDAAARAWLGGDAEQEWTTDHPWVSREFVQRSGAAVVRGVVDGFLPAGKGRWSDEPSSFHVRYDNGKPEELEEDRMAEILGMPLPAVPNVQSTGGRAGSCPCAACGWAWDASGGGPFLRAIQRHLRNDHSSHDRTTIPEGWAEGRTAVVPCLPCPFRGGRASDAPGALQRLRH